MVDVNVVTAKLAELSRRIDRVRKRAKPSRAELAADDDALDVVSLNLMVAVQACADIASHLIADEGWQPASSIAESFRRLAERGVISTSTAAVLSRAVGLRNIVAHGYERVDAEMVHEASTTGLTDLEMFMREVAVWLRTRIAQ